MARYLPIEPYLTRWGLTLDGDAFDTASSRLAPVRRGSELGMLKLALVDEERVGGELMVWWDGEGSAQVLEHDGAAILLERATGAHSLTEMARMGEDDEASRTICRTAAILHAPRAKPLPNLVPLDVWFRDLFEMAATYGGTFTKSLAMARALLANPQEVVTLHGDLHHENVLDFGERGWRAIDPKGLYGERGFDFANIFCNPDGETARVPGRLARQVAVVAEEASLDRRRLLQWILAWTGLSAVWMIQDGMDLGEELAIGEMAATLGDFRFETR